MKTDLLAFGELIADFLPYGESDQGYPVYEFNPGGAPANLAAAVKKLGLSTGIVGKVGRDPLGQMLQADMLRRGISCEGVTCSQSWPTALSMVHLSKEGERSFSFFADLSADMDLSSAELPYELIGNCRLFHFGARSLILPSAREATLSAAAYARKSDALISFDPNLRPTLWKDMQTAAADALTGIQQADLIKLSFDEMQLVYATDNTANVLRSLAAQGKVCVVTDGAKGAYVWENASLVHVPTYPIKQVDTTGAGDAFWAAFLYQCLSYPQSSLQQRVRFACAAGAIACTRKGAMTAHPTCRDIEAFTENK